MVVVISALPAAFDLAGTFVFALSGAAAGIKNRLDVFGVLVLSFATGNSGGIARDLLIGVVPPAAIRDWGDIALSIFAGLITFYRYRLINTLNSPVLVFDAAGQGRRWNEQSAFTRWQRPVARWPIQPALSLRRAFCWPLSRRYLRSTVRARLLR